MRRSIATVSLSGGLQEKLYAAAAARFNMVEIYENDLTFYDGTPADVRRLLEELGLGVSLFQPFPDFEGVSDEAFARNMQRARRKFDLMGELGAPMLMVPSNVSPAALADQGRAAAQLHALAEAAAARDLRVGYVALPWGARVRRWRDAWRLVEAADHPALGLILDSFNILAARDDPAGIADLPGDRIFLIQLADAPRVEMELEALSRHFRCFPGQGGLDVAGFVRAALAAGYGGPLSIQVFNDDLRAQPARQIALEAMRSLLFVEDQLDPGVHVPPAPAVDGVGFIEFAVDAASEPELAAWLTGLGFVLAGRHRTKEATLYAQGGVLIVLNTGTDSFAHAYRQLHGLSVCALGLRTGDPQGLLTRAEHYGYKRYEERRGPNEHPLPAIRAPDGSLIHLIDRGYDPFEDFAPVQPGPAGPQVGLDHVDHIARAVPAGQFDSWLLYHRVLLGLEPEPSWDLPDPHGLVRSRALASHDKRLRLPLTFSESSRTVVARSLTTFAGAGVNQIAFETADIFAAVEAMQARGARLLTIAPNYYAELPDRFTIAGPLLERLRAHNILYDEDGAGGVFLHAYTETFQDRFFFEVLQRIGGYDQYGAANAPVRMAAQARRRTPEPRAKIP